jgi:hypothetical protein
MKTITTAIAFACSACLLAGGAAAGPRFGVADDAGKYSDDGGAAVYKTLADLGMTDNRVAVLWDASRPAEIVEKPFLDRALPVAREHGIRVVFAVSPRRARSLTVSRTAAPAFAAFLQLLARTYPEVEDFVIGNEPNQPRFWQPQFVRGRGVSGAAYQRVLAMAYDALKAVDPDIRVIGVGLSPRGNDRPNAKSNVSTSPVRFLRDMGRAYRASGRRTPIMDALAFHPYPRFDRDPLTRGYAWPNAGITNLDRIKQAVWDAFHDTGQPTFAEAGEPVDEDGPEPLRFTLDEVGWQVRIPARSRRAYTGRESVRPTDEGRQAQIYRQIVDIAACDPAIESLLFFHLIDERDLDRFQSGLVRADWTHRPSYFTVKSRIAQLTTEDGVQCPGRPVAWRHTESVVGPWARFAPPPGGRIGFLASAREEVTYVAGLFPVSGLRVLESLEEDAIRFVLGQRNVRAFGLRAVFGKLRANERRAIRFRAAAVPPGRYVYAIRLAATMNPERATVLIGEPFAIRRARRIRSSPSSPTRTSRAARGGSRTSASAGSRPRISFSTQATWSPSRCSTSSARSARPCTRSTETWTSPRSGSRCRASSSSTRAGPGSGWCTSRARGRVGRSAWRAGFRAAPRSSTGTRTSLRSSATATSGFSIPAAPPSAGAGRCTRCSCSRSTRESCAQSS